MQQRRHKTIVCPQHTGCSSALVHFTHYNSHDCIVDNDLPIGYITIVIKTDLCEWSRLATHQLGIILLLHILVTSFLGQNKGRDYLVIGL